VLELALGRRSVLRPATVAAALAALESEGFALRGHFTPGAEAEEWCERRLLARIDRYTVKRLRAEIKPVAVRDLSSRAGRWSVSGSHPPRSLGLTIR
jgi:ATP-dependent helicase Lhr and Lhr-like helicase